MGTLDSAERETEGIGECREGNGRYGRVLQEGGCCERERVQLREEGCCHARERVQLRARAIVSAQ